MRTPLFGLFLLSVVVVTSAQRGSSRQPPRRLNINPGTSSGTLKFPDSETDGDSPCRFLDGSEGVCSHFSSCLGAFDNIEAQLNNSRCQSADNRVDGVCCPKRAPPSAKKARIKIPTQVIPPSVDIPISASDLDASGRTSLNFVSRLDALEAELKKRGLTVEKGSRESFHYAFFGKKDIAIRLGRDGLIGLEATLDLAKKYEIPRTGSSRSFEGTIIGSHCPQKPPCPSSKYRKIDGSCNNLRHPDWGKSFTAMQRLLPPAYEDGIDEPRGGWKSRLPSGRLVSRVINRDEDIPNQRFALIIMQWAQFVDHDLTLAFLTRTRSGEGIKCCHPDIIRNPQLRHPACFPIEIPDGDTFYSKHRQTCIDLVRNIAAPRAECFIGPREQINQLTAFLDGSQIYGSTNEEASDLRSFVDGRMKSTFYRDQELLPQEENDNEDCRDSQGSNFLCFKAGDERVNEQVDLTVMHTIWVREHNRVAGELKKLNPGWNDEILYQESRRIVSAEFQHITYNEFLPAILGKDVMETFGILLNPFGHIYDYDPNLNPAIINGFATAAYRYGHTFVQGDIHLVGKNDNLVDVVKLHTQFNDPRRLYRQGELDRFLKGLIMQPAQTFDSFITSELTNRLFQLPNESFGMDLIAINIQRGREHGIPPYNEWRRACGLPPHRHFNDLYKVMSPEAATNFAKLYRSVDDIDLFPAGVSETSVPGGSLGPTFACIVAEQFRRAKFGDRFWYENGKMESSFTPAQLKELKKSSLARIICDTSYTIDKVQPLAFHRMSAKNPRIDCRDPFIPRVSLGPWKNEPVWA